MFVHFIHRKPLSLSVHNLYYLDSGTTCVVTKCPLDEKNVYTLRQTNRRVPRDRRQVVILSLCAACHLRDDNNTPYQDYNWGVSYRWPCFGNLWNLIRFYQSVKGAHAQVNCARHMITTLRSDKRGISVWMNMWPLALYHPFIMRVLPGRREQQS